MTKRCHLFKASASKSVLWCAESWTLTLRQKRHLRSVQRAMLRRMFGPGRQPDEEYIHWIRRSTKVAEERSRRAGIKCWSQHHRQLKWRWAGRLANMTDEPWARKVTLWRDSVWQLEHGAIATRPRRDCLGNRLRWEDEIQRFTEQSSLGPWQHATLNGLKSQETALIK